MTKTHNIQAAQPRDHVQVIFNNKTPYEGKAGSTLQDFFEVWEQDNHIPPHQRAIAAVVDNRLRELTVPVTRDVIVKPITLMDSDGNRIYRRTLSFLLVVAVAECFPNGQVIIEHATPSGAFLLQNAGTSKFNT